ncbi:hypothetical protein QYE76_019934 [Lolium multiflorum]|uniref:Pollen allergen Poa p IX/Phl p VI domain-containing protein n=1 Tax=Lolium multiflorum TaxID=4521 RepID=A0AAD8VNM1_LOLMU|nr:hypothetical protein QYE76_019934 [Lolium multiflorum]
MAPQQQHKTAVVAVFLAALVLALPAAAYRPEATGYTPGGSTPAEATPTEAAGSTPAEAGTPVAGGYTPGAAASTPAEATPTDAAVSTPTEASTPAEETPTEAAVSTPSEAGTSVVAGYTPAAAAGTTPAAESGKATTDVQKLMEMVNGVYKKALEAANAAAPDDKFSVFDAAFTKGIQGGLADRIMPERVLFSTMINRAIKDAYVSTSAINVASEEERFSVFVFTLTEALRVMAATVEAHAIKPAAEEEVAGGAKEPAGDQLVIEKMDAAVKAAADASKEAPLSDKFLVFEATFSKAFKDEMGPAYDENKAIPQLNAAYKEAYKATVAATPEKRFDAFLNGLTKYIMAISQTAAKTGAGSKPAAEATTEPAAEDATKQAPETAVKPAAEAAYKPAAQAAAKPAGGAVGGYNL